MAADDGLAVHQHRWRAMGSDAHLVVVGAPGNDLPTAVVLHDGIARIEDLEARWSRFRPASEISELNRRPGEAVEVSSETVLLIEHAIEAWRFTGGGFDPTVLDDVVAAGYDRSFDEMSTMEPVGAAPALHAPREAQAGRRPLMVACTDIEVRGSLVTLPAGTGFDPGGIGKGLAADVVVRELLGAGALGACVNLGGDLRVAGLGPDGGTWTIGLEHPWLDEPYALLGLAGGAVATSTTLLRRWSAHDGTTRHHLIDPATGEPSTSDLALVSVVAAEAWYAEVLAKAILLRGQARAFDLVDPARAEVVTVDVDGLVNATAGISAFLGGATLPVSILRPDPTLRNEGEHP